MARRAQKKRTARKVAKTSSSTPRYHWKGGRRLNEEEVEQLWCHYQRLSAWRRKAAIRDAELWIDIVDQPGTSGVVYTREGTRKIYVELHVGHDESEVRTAILHEMAHIDSPKDVHGKTWRQRFVAAAEEAHGDVLRGFPRDLLNASETDLMVHFGIKVRLEAQERARFMRAAPAEDAWPEGAWPEEVWLEEVCA
ncbi:MAG: hypothetical protein JRH20_05470 [Deltaproteobacteria bacterium]|nr:hypothetical protein [Deltaproteobacteria bacterium]